MPSPIKIRNAVTTVFKGLDIPADRTRASKCFSYLREINQAAFIGKSLASDQLDWLTDAIKDKTQAMYPDRYTDLSNPALVAELRQLEKQKGEVAVFAGLVEQLAIETEVRLPKSAPQMSSVQPNEYDGM